MLFDVKWAQSQLARLSPTALAIFRKIVVDEGGYSNRAADRGGPTNFGVTLRTAQSYGLAFDYDGDGVVGVADLKRITAVIAEGFYSYAYYLSPKINLIDADVQPVVTDISVNMGQGTASLMLQRAINVVRARTSIGSQIVPAPIVEDGAIGQATARACGLLCDAFGSATIVNAVCDLRDDRYRDIVAKDPTQKANINGWLNRSDRYRAGV